jgi:hypothetical protein
MMQNGEETADLGSVSFVPRQAEGFALWSAARVGKIERSIGRLAGTAIRSNRDSTNASGAMV